MQWALVDGENTVVNIIVYDGLSPYVAPEGLTLEQVGDEVHIGDKLD